MRKIKEVLRPRFGLGLHQSQVARSCSIGQATVHFIDIWRKPRCGRGELALREDWDDVRLEELFIPGGGRPPQPAQPEPSGLCRDPSATAN